MGFLFSQTPPCGSFPNQKQADLSKEGIGFLLRLNVIGFPLRIRFLWFPGTNEIECPKVFGHKISTMQPP